MLPEVSIDQHDFDELVAAWVAELVLEGLSATVQGPSFRSVGVATTALRLEMVISASNQPRWLE
jgi:hypothetical protein